MSDTFLVTGATGRVGRAAVANLLRLGQKVHAYVRNPDSEASRQLAKQGAKLFVGDFSSEEALSKASKSCNGLFILTNPEGDQDEPFQIRTILSAFQSNCEPDAVAVLMTSLGVSEHETFPSWPPPVPFMVKHWLSKAQLQTILQNSGMPHWTILQPGWFMANFIDKGLRSLQWPQLSKEKKLVAAVQPETVFELVDPSDVGRFVTKALLEKGQEKWEHQTVKICSQLLTLGEIAWVLSRVSGISVEAIFTEPKPIQEMKENDFLAYMHVWQNARAPQVYLEDLEKYEVTLTTWEDYLLERREAVIEALSDGESEQIHIA